MLGKRGADAQKRGTNMAKTRDGSEQIDDWATPSEIYEALNAEFHFDFDPCPLHADFDGLKVEWGSSNFINPPYNRFDKPKFIQKAYEEWLKGKTCVLLIPAATSTAQFHDLMLPNAEIRFFKGRIRFLKNGDKCSKGKGKHDSMLVIFRAEGRRVKVDKEIKYISRANQTVVTHQGVD